MAAKSKPEALLQVAIEIGSRSVGREIQMYCRLEDMRDKVTAALHQLRTGRTNEALKTLREAEKI